MRFIRLQRLNRARRVFITRSLATLATHFLARHALPFCFNRESRYAFSTGRFHRRFHCALLIHRVRYRYFVSSSFFLLILSTPRPRLLFNWLSRGRTCSLNRQHRNKERSLFNKMTRRAGNENTFPSDTRGISRWEKVSGNTKRDTFATDRDR